MKPMTEERLSEIREGLNSVQRAFNPWPRAVQELFDEVCRLRVLLETPVAKPGSTEP